MILSNSPVLGSRGIFTDWAMHTPPAGQSLVSLGGWGSPTSCPLHTHARRWGLGLPKVPSLTPGPQVPASGHKPFNQNSHGTDGGSTHQLEGLGVSLTYSASVSLPSS